MTSRRCARLTPELLTQEAAFRRRAGAAANQGNGGWAEWRRPFFVGDNPPDAAVITYYQKIAASLR